MAPTPATRTPGKDEHMTATATTRRRAPKADRPTVVEPAPDGEIDSAQPSTPEGSPSAEAAAARRFGMFDWSSPTPIYAGIGLVVVGFAVIAYSWGRVAGEDSVAFQLPYIISGGVGGLGILLVGLTVINVTAKQRDAVERQRQLDVLSEILDRIAATLDRDQP